MTMPGGHQGRLDELAANLATVQTRIDEACAAAARSPGEVHLIAVTKTFPVSDIMLLSQLGVIDIGENRDQEAAPKAAACKAAGLTLCWHFVGQLQLNKVPSVAGYADVVHSVDRQRLIVALGRRAMAAGRTISCLVQVSLDDDLAGPAAGRGMTGSAGTDRAVSGPGPAGRGGAAPEQVPGLADAIAAEPGLLLAGVMAVAPLGQPARPAYARLRTIAERVRSEHPDAVAISAGMSGDLEDAIAEGATHVRIGTALLGGRRAFVR